MICLLKVGSQRDGEAEQLSQGHTANKCQTRIQALVLGSRHPGFTDTLLHCKMRYMAGVM